MVRDSKDHETTAKLTPQREAVLQAIRTRDDHPTANEIFEAARAILPTISYATVYNSLRYLRETGLVREIRFGEGATVMDGITERHDHAFARLWRNSWILISTKPPTSCVPRRANHASSPRECI